MQLCCGLNVCVPRGSFTCRSPNHQYGYICNENSKEVIKVKWGHRAGRRKSNKINVLRRRDTRKYPSYTLSTSMIKERPFEDKATVLQSGVYTPGSELSLASNHAGTLILNFKPPKQNCRNNFLLLKTYTLRYFPRAAWAHQYTLYLISIIVLPWSRRRARLPGASGDSLWCPKSAHPSLAFTPPIPSHFPFFPHTVGIIPPINSTLR